MLLFEQALLTLVREMPVKACARYVGVNDKRLWRVIKHYVEQALTKMDLSALKEIGLDELLHMRQVPIQPERYLQKCPLQALLLRPVY